MVATIDQEQLEYYVGSFERGLVVSPPASFWSTDALLQLAGAGLHLCSRRMPAAQRGELSTAVEWCAEATDWVRAGWYAEFLERRHTVEASMSGGQKRVEITRGRKQGRQSSAGL